MCYVEIIMNYVEIIGKEKEKEKISSIAPSKKMALERIFSNRKELTFSKEGAAIISR